jgi:hypothetical protein
MKVIHQGIYGRVKKGLDNVFRETRTLIKSKTFFGTLLDRILI